MGQSPAFIMTTSLRLALGQFDFLVGDVRGNCERIITRIAEARDVHGADLVVFPELAVSGYLPEDLLLRRNFLAECTTAMDRIAAACRGIVAIVGWPEAADAVVYNAASVLRDGAIAATYRKRELPNYAVFDERRYFAVDPDGGPCVFEIRGVSVGVLICQDLWHPEPMHETAAAGAHLVVVPNASPFERDKHAERDALLAQRARDTGVAIAYVNVVGAQDGTVFDGCSLLADGDGHVHPAALAFEPQWLLADFDASTRHLEPTSHPVQTDERAHVLAWRAVVLGTRDYCHKNGFEQVWVGLSGGLDSSVVLAIAVDALGADHVTAVRLPSRFTASVSNHLAQEQCRTLRVRLVTLPIEGPFQRYLDALPHVSTQTPLDVTEENLQARIRGMLLMALTNKLGGLLLTTGNKSEYAIGYTTIYGDMCGGYAPIKDLYKTEVAALARWRNKETGAPIIPRGVIERPPSAELRDNQRDQDTLPPYDILDAILFRYVDQEQSRDEIVAAGYDPETVGLVLRLVRLSEWKRHQAAPGPKVSRRAFGRERRYPITDAWTSLDAAGQLRYR